MISNEFLIELCHQTIFPFTSTALIAASFSSDFLSVQWIKWKIK
jgi:hypothetical protein